MKRFLLLGAVAALVMAAALPAASEAAVSVGVSIHVGDPYRGMSLQFRSEPDLVRVPDSQVYYVPNYDHDLYRYGRDWYFVEDGTWYRSSSYRGPFFRVDYGSVPQAVCQVPTRYRRSWNGPPDHARSYGYRRQQGGSDRSWGGQQQNGRNGRNDGNDRNDRYDRNSRDDRNSRYDRNSRDDRNGGDDRSGTNDRNGRYDRQGDRNDGRDGGNDRQNDRGGW